MKTLIYITIIKKKYGLTISTPSLHSAWDNKEDTIEECKRLKLKEIDSFYVCEPHNYINGHKFTNI